MGGAQELARVRAAVLAPEPLSVQEPAARELDRRAAVGPFFAGAGPGTQEELVPEALRRANAYLAAGVDCVYPIALWETDALRRFMSEVRGAVNVMRLPQAPTLAELAALGVARVSWATLLHLDAMARFKDQLASVGE